MLKVELVDSYGQRTDVTYADISLRFVGEVTPEVRATLAEWEEQRRHWRGVLCAAFGIPADLLRDMHDSD